MTAFPTYSTGTIAIDANATVVVGVGSNWAGQNAVSGDALVVGGNSVIISDVTDSLHLAIDAWPFAAVTAGTSYSIKKNSPLRFAGGQAMAAVDTLVAALNTSGFFVFVDSDELVPDPSLGDDGQYAMKPTNGEVWLKVGGVWVSQGIYGNLAATDVPWSGTTTYGPNIIVPFAGKLWRSLQGANINQQPDTSPTWWAVFLSGGDTVYIAYDDSDRPASGEIVLKFVSPKTMTFFATMVDSFGNATVAATASAVYSICKNGTQFATATFAVAGTAPTFTCATNAVFAAGDILTMVAPSPRDATLSGIGITLTAYR